MRVLVLGAGVSGMAATRLARRHGHAVTVFDEAVVPQASLLGMGVGVVTGGWDPGLLEGVDLVVASPGFPERSLPVVDALEAGIPIWSEIEFGWRLAGNRPVVAVTGTNGKTTVTRLTTEILTGSGMRAVAAGNIGTAFSDVVEDDWQLAVVEMSSFQLRFIDRFHPVGAAVLNVATDHLDWHGSAEAYRAAKARIFQRQTPDDLLVFDVDDPGAAAVVRPAEARLHPVSATRRPPGGSGVEGGNLSLPGMSIPLEEMGSTDPAHVVDQAAAAVLALDRGASAEAVRSSLRSFSPSPHRRTLVATVGGVQYVDDSKATNPHAALAAAAAYPSVVLIAGGLAKGLDLTPLAHIPNLVALVGIGTAGPELARAARDRGYTAGTMEEAVGRAASLAQPGDTILLAPGAASFDQFGSYAERGDSFVAAVRRLERQDPQR
ncbi:MAG: UDP-N-acetylmuramoyl-L-alanine--D-glutamate ligase [Actinomycetota bacterium]